MDTVAAASVHTQSDKLHYLIWISYLDKNILPMQMAEKLAVEFNVKNVIDRCMYTQTSSFIWFGL